MANKPKDRQQWIIDELKLNPTTSYTEMLAKYKQMFAKSKVTFDKDWKTSSESFKEYQLSLNKAKDEASINEEVQSLKNGLKSKTERLMILQKQIDDSISELEDGYTTEMKYDPDVKGWENVVRPMTVLEKKHLRGVIKDMQAEISKIQGDYAPTKLNHSGEIKGADLGLLTTQELIARSQAVKKINEQA